MIAVSQAASTTTATITIAQIAAGDAVVRAASNMAGLPTSTIPRRYVPACVTPTPGTARPGNRAATAGGYRNLARHPAPVPRPGGIQRADREHQVARRAQRC